MADEMSYDTPFMVAPDDFDLGIGTIVEPGPLPEGTTQVTVRLDGKTPEDPVIIALHPQSLLKLLDFVVRHREELKLKL